MAFTSEQALKVMEAMGHSAPTPELAAKMSTLITGILGQPPESSGASSGATAAVEERVAKQEAVLERVTQSLQALASLLTADEERKRNMTKNDDTMDSKDPNEEEAKRISAKLQREGMSERRGFTNLPSHGNSTEKFEDWRFRVRGFLDRETWLATILDAIESEALKPENAEVEVKDTTFILKSLVGGPDVELGPEVWEGHGTTEVERLAITLSDELYQCLRQLLTDSSADMLQNLECDGPCRGFEAWARLHKDYAGDNGPRQLSLCDAVFYPRRVNMEDVPSALEQHDKRIAKLEKNEETKLGPLIRMFSLMRLLPVELAGDFLKETTRFGRSFAKAKRWVLDQVVVRRKDTESHKKGLHALPSQEEEGYGAEEPSPDEAFNELPDETKHQLMGMFGKGKAKGKGGTPFRFEGSFTGKFEGECNWCGIYGHRARECRKKDAHMDSIRQGKGGKGIPGKGGSSGPGFPSPFGSGGFKGKGMNKGGQQFPFIPGGKSQGKGYYGKGKGASLNSFDSACSWLINQDQNYGNSYSPPGISAQGFSGYPPIMAAALIPKKKDIALANSFQAFATDDDKDDPDDTSTGSTCVSCSDLIKIPELCASGCDCGFEEVKRKRTRFKSRRPQAWKPLDPHSDAGAFGATKPSQPCRGRGDSFPLRTPVAAKQGGTESDAEAKLREATFGSLPGLASLQKLLAPLVAKKQKAQRPA